MDTIDLNGVSFVKAAKAARDMGYTPDYVGQMCRAGKIEATLVGRTWYVRDGALDSYRREKPRLNKKSASKDVERTIKANVVTEKTSSSRMPSYKKQLLEPSITYSTDSEEVVVPVRSLSSEEVTVAVNEEEAPEEIEEKEVAEGEHNIRVRVKDGNRGGTAFVGEKRVYRAKGSVKVVSYDDALLEEQSKEVAVTKKKPLPVPKTAPKKTAIEVIEYVENVNSEEGVTSISTFRWSVSIASVLLMVGLVSANLLLESTWTYQGDETTQQPLSTAYGVASLVNLME